MKCLPLFLLTLLCLCTSLKAANIDSLRRVEATATGEMLANVSGHLSKAYLRSNTDSSLYFALQQLAAATEAAIPREQMLGYIHIGFAYKYLGDFPRSLEHNLKALTMARELNDSTSQADFLSSTATLYRRMGDYEQSKDYFLQALKLREVLGDSVLLGSTLMNYGILLNNMEEPEASLESYKRALQLYASAKDTARMSRAVANIGAQLMNMERLAEAEIYVQQGMELAHRFDDQVQVSNSLINLGLIQELQEHYLAAYDYYKQAEKVAEAIPLPQRLEYLYHSQARALGGAGQYEKAFNLEREAYFTRDSMFQIEKAETLARLQADFEVAEKDLEISRLEEEKAREELENTQLWAGIGGLILLITLGAMAYGIQQIRRRQAEEIRQREMEKRQFSAVITGEEKERRRIASDLHDSLGQLLSATILHLTSLDSPAKESQHVLEARKLVDKSVDEVRQISHNLAPPALLSGGLGPAISDLARMVRSTQAIEVIEQQEELPEHFPKDKQIHLFRIVQELVNNSLKHSGCTQLNLTTSTQADRLHLSVSDNGKGFDPATLQREGGGLGWHSIRGRLSMLEGDMEVNATPLKGTEVKVWVPISAG